MASRDLNLDGTEVSIIKALGFGSTETTGADLIERCADLAIAELIDSLQGLMSLGYVVADKSAFYKKEELERISFRVNSGYMKDLRDALDPRPEPKKSKRVRRE
jgi:hypothetical protein